MLIVCSYKHGVICPLLSDSLLRKVRQEVLENISFTPKETDIYRIEQSGDLANLDGLEEDALRRLPSLKTLRDAMYSEKSRNFLSQVTDSGPLSGTRTDMAINVYTPGCHLLCHDDVIGTRRVSYILYLTDPDHPWQKEWGGALQLYPTETHVGADGQAVKVPSQVPSVSIPPAFNQLSFFAVQPGASYHDVEEVYAPDKDDPSPRIRMAISGWYHIPQEGEQDYVKNSESKLEEKSSLKQLEAKENQSDGSLAKPQDYDFLDSAYSSMEDPQAKGDSESTNDLTEQDLDFLLKYMGARYLAPDTLESVAEIFEQDFSIILDAFLSEKFAMQIRQFITEKEEKQLSEEKGLATRAEQTAWALAVGPQKHRFLYYQPTEVEAENPINDILYNLIPSQAFRKWLRLATGQMIRTHSAHARRFRRGQDYTLAQRYDKDDPNLELCLSLTPTTGWGGNQEEIVTDNATAAKPTAKDKEVPSAAEKSDESQQAPDVGGYLAYMVGDEEDDEGEQDASNVHTKLSADNKSQSTSSASTGANAQSIKTPARKSKADPAIYQAPGTDDDDPVLLHMPATWNQVALVLRDKGTMKFVKYVSRAAKGDRWDIVGEFEVDEPFSDDEVEAGDWDGQDNGEEEEELAADEEPEVAEDVEEASTEIEDNDRYGEEGEEDNEVK